MTESEQRKFKAQPINILNGFAKGLLAVRQSYCAANFGSVTVVGDGTFLRIGGEDLIGFHLSDDGNLEFSLRLYSKSDELLLNINRNEWISGNPLPWDIKADWQTLTLREHARHISVSLNAKSVPLELQAELWRSGKLVKIDKSGIRIGTLPASGISELALVGMLLDIQINEPGFKLGPHPIYPHACIVSWPNRRERLWKAKDAWMKIEASITTKGLDST